jgi:hypothetical protein
MSKGFPYGDRRGILYITIEQGSAAAGHGTLWARVSSGFRISSEIINTVLIEIIAYIGRVRRCQARIEYKLSAAVSRSS